MLVCILVGDSTQCSDHAADLSERIKQALEGRSAIWKGNEATVIEFIVD